MHSFCGGADLLYEIEGAAEEETVVGGLYRYDELYGAGIIESTVSF